MYVRAHLARVTVGDVKRLLLQIGPRHGKSEQNTVRYSAYRIEHDLSMRVVQASYSQFLANKFSRKTRRLLTQNGVELSRERTAVEDWEVHAPHLEIPGGVRAVGVGGGITGAGAHLLNIDDPVKSRKEAESETYREWVSDWYADDLYTRLEPGGAILLTMARWHDDDLAGRIERNYYGDLDEWVIINLPALAEDENDPLGREPGEALCPERYDEAALEQRKRVLGDGFYALYQGRPVAGSGNTIKREWFNYYTEAPGEHEVLAIVQSLDTGTKDNESNDPSVLTTWAITRQYYFLLHEWRERVTYPALKKKVKLLAERWKPTAILIEDKGNGSALIQDARANTQLPVIAIEPTGQGDKVLRLGSEASAYEAGLVKHPLKANEPWIIDFEAELVAIPNAPNDDRGDSVSQFLGWARKRGFNAIVDTSGNVRDSAEADTFTGGAGLDFGGFD